MSDQGTEEKDLGAQDSTVSAGDKPADTRIAPGVTEQNHTESEAGVSSAVQPKERQLISRTIGAIAACAIALVAVLAGTGGIGTDSEKHAYITQSGCGKQRVNQRMGCDITVRITFDAVTIPTQTGKP